MLIESTEQTKQEMIGAIPSVSQTNIAEKAIIFNFGLGTFAMSIVSIMGSHVSFSELKNAVFLGISIFLLGFSTFCALWLIIIPQSTTSKLIYLLKRDQRDEKELRENRTAVARLFIATFLSSLVACAFLGYFTLSNPQALFQIKPKQQQVQTAAPSGSVPRCANSTTPDGSQRAGKAQLSR